MLPPAPRAPQGACLAASLPKALPRASWPLLTPTAPTTGNIYPAFYFLVFCPCPRLNNDSPKDIHALTIPANVPSYGKGVFGTGIKVRMSLWGDHSGLSRWPSMQPQVSLKEGARRDSQPQWGRGGEGGAESLRTWASEMTRLQAKELSCQATSNWKPGRTLKPPEGGRHHSR